MESSAPILCKPARYFAANYGTVNRVMQITEPSYIESLHYFHYSLQIAGIPPANRVTRLFCSLFI